MKPYSIDDAEKELRTALNAGDTDAINRLEKVIDTLDVRQAKPSLASTALWYVENGIRVFPLRAGSKQPFGKCAGCHEECGGPDECGHDLCHGLKDATLDVDRARRWWGKTPDANIGLATGHTFDVVDIDGPLGQQSRMQHWDDIFAQIDADSIAKALTPRPGGMHIYVPATGDGNATGIVPGVDYRGLGGYVLAPPSEIVAGGKDYPGHYSYLGTPSLTSVA